MAAITPYEGRWRAVIRRVGYKTRSKIHSTKKQAEAWARSIENEIDSGKYRDPAKGMKLTVQELFEKFRDEVAPTRKGHRWETVRIDKLLDTADFVARRLDQLTPDDITVWRDHRLTQVSASSVKREMNLISGIFKHAMMEWRVGLSFNPMHLVSRPKNADRERNRRWHQHEIDAVLEAAGWKEDVKPRIGKDMVGWALLIAIETAMRPSELCALKVKDFHPAEFCVRLHDSKNDDGRDVPLSSKALKWLTFITEGRGPNELIFMLQWESLGQYFRKVREKAGLADADIRFRDSRREGTTRLAKKFSNALELSAVTGHRSLQSLKPYYKPTAKELAARMD